MARRFNTPKGGGSKTVPITARRIKRATLDRIKAFITEDEMKDDDGNVTGTKFRPKLALYWNSGHIQRDEAGEPVYDADGNEQTHYIVDGFVAISGYRSSNMVKSILPALGIEGEAFIHQQDGSSKGSLKDDEFGFIFGENALGDDYSGIESLEDLPEYRRGGKARKGEVECEVTSWVVYDEDGEGYELLGRAVELELTIDNDWNRIKSYMLPEDFTDLIEEGERAQNWLADLRGESRPAAKKTGKAKTGGKSKSKKSDGDDDTMNKAHAFVTRTLDAAGVEVDHRAAVLGLMLLGEGHKIPIADLEMDHCTEFRNMTNVGKDLDPVHDANTAITNDQFPPEEDLPW